MGAGVGSPFTCRDDPLNRLNRCATQICLLFAWWLTYAFAVSLVNRPPPGEGPDSLRGSRWKRREGSRRKGKIQSRGPSSASTAGPHVQVPFCPRRHLTGPAPPGWGEGTMLSHLRCVSGSLWTPDRRCRCRRAHRTPLLKKVLDSLLSGIWWLSFQSGS